MTDILFPPDLAPAAMMFGVDDFTAVDESATSGAMQSSALYGTRRWHLRLDFQTISRSNGSLARFESLVASLRGRANRVWISPAGAAARRGSFPATELFANNDFSNGVTSWNSDAAIALSALDHSARATRSNTGAAQAFTQSITRSAGIGYALRALVLQGKGISGITLADGGAAYNSPSLGMLEAAFTTVAGASPTGLFDFTSAETAGAFFDAKWTSLSRCAQVDNGVNLLLNSDTPGTGTGWSLNMATAATASFGGPDGLPNAWKITETATTGSHYALQAVTVSSAAADYSYSIFVNQAGSPRGFCWVQILETLGSTSAIAYVNLSTGAVTNISGGANISVIGTPIAVNYGGGWWRVILTVRKTNAATTIQVVTGTAQTPGTQSFAGSTSAFLVVWRASLAQSSVPVQPIQTAGTAQAGTLQTGFNLNLKALPASTQGLLLEGDVVECLMPNNSQLLRVVQRLDSDAAGLGTLIFENALKQSPIDGAGVVVQQPMGRFVLASSTLGIEYDPGVFGSASLEFVEAA